MSVWKLIILVGPERIFSVCEHNVGGLVITRKWWIHMSPPRIFLLWALLSFFLYHGPKVVTRRFLRQWIIFFWLLFQGQQTSSENINPKSPHNLFLGALGMFLKMKSLKGKWMSDRLVTFHWRSASHSFSNTYRPRFHSFYKAVSVPQAHDLIVFEGELLLMACGPTFKDEIMNSLWAKKNVTSVWDSFMKTLDSSWWPQG